MKSFFKKLSILLFLLPTVLFAQEAGVLNSSDQITQLLSGSSLSLTLMTFFGFGLLLALTPCVLPMIPILSGIIIGKKDITHKKAFLLSVVFVLASSVTYSVAGVLAGYFGENLQVLFQNPWALISFSLIFIALAFSMFGFYELQMPKFIQNEATELSSKGGSGYLGASIMGFLSTLIVGPCVAPPLAGALIYIGQTGDALLGGLALFSLSIGMGIPLIIVGTGISKLPKAGIWMEKVKKLFGILMLGLAIWILERLLTEQISLLLWAILILSAPVVIGMFRDSNILTRIIGVILIVYGLMVLGMSYRGSGDMLNPVGSLMTDQEQLKLQKIKFETIKTLVELKVSLNENKVAIVDFYADWCISCKEMEKEIFSNKSVVDLSKGIKYIKIDVTKNDAEDKEILKFYGIIGPPTVLFYNSGKELKSMRIIGEVSVETFKEKIIAINF
jgi:thiol:disulfide interchange protein DsbD